MRKLVFIVLLCIISGEIFSQGYNSFSHNRFVFWRPLSLSGEIKFEADYRHMKVINDQTEGINEGSRFSGGILLNSKSFLLAPNFLVLDVIAEFNPQKISNNYFTVPDYSENRTTKRLGFKTNILRNKSVSINTNTDFRQTYGNREYLSNIKTNSKQFAVNLLSKNKVLPFTLNFNKHKFDQEEIENGRFTLLDQMNFTARTSKSFFKRDQHEFEYSHNEYSFENVGIYTNNTYTDYFSVQNKILFDSAGNYKFNSYVTYRDQKGLRDFKRLNVYENLFFRLPLNFTFIGSYKYNTIDQELLTTKTNVAKGLLSHKLFLSLNTNVYYEYINQSNAIYNETRHNYGGDIYYTKKIALNGRFNINYKFNRLNFNTRNSPSSIEIFNESHVLTDGQIVLLDRPFVDISTIFVRDATGAILYQEGLDYIVIERNNYVEIQRFPGGLIADGTTILVDYIVNLPLSNSYSSNFNNLYTSVSIFDRLVEIYFRYSRQNFINTENTELMTLNYFDRFHYGIKTDFKFISGGYEYEDYRSSIIPYKLNRFYLSAHKSINDRILMSLNGNVRDYHLVDEDLDQLFSDISGKVVYRIIDLTKASLDLGYRRQIGSGIDLNLLTARLEVTSQIRDIYLTIGYQKYNRNFLGDINNHNGAYFRLLRRF